MKAGTFVVEWEDPAEWEVKAEGLEAGREPPWTHWAALSEWKSADIEEALNALTQAELDQGGLPLIGSIIDRVIMAPDPDGGELEE